MALFVIEGNTKIVYDDSDNKLHVITYNTDGTVTDHGAIDTGT